MFDRVKIRFWLEDKKVARRCSSKHALFTIFAILSLFFNKLAGLKLMLHISHNDGTVTTYPKKIPKII